MIMLFNLKKADLIKAQRDDLWWLHLTDLRGRIHKVKVREEILITLRDLINDSLEREEEAQDDQSEIGNERKE
jgi:hypothetical protein